MHGARGQHAAPGSANAPQSIEGYGKIVSCAIVKTAS